MGRLCLVKDGGEALASADLVIEAITENLPLKQVTKNPIFLDIFVVGFSLNLSESVFYFNICIVQRVLCYLYQLFLLLSQQVMQ